MSYYNRIKICLNPVGKQESDFYIKATKNALENYFKDLKAVFSSSPFMLNGLVTIGTYSYPITGVLGGNVMSIKLLPPSELNIKTALWSTPHENCFSNLFDEIGQSISKSFTLVSAQPKVSGPSIPIVLNTVHFRSYGLQFMAKIKTIGVGLNADIFHQTLSEYIEKAIKAIPQMSVPVSGIWLAGGTFNGSVLVNFNDARL